MERKLVQIVDWSVFLRENGYMYIIWLSPFTVHLSYHSIVNWLWSEVKVSQSCPTLCDPMSCSPSNSPGQNTGVGSVSLLQEIFPTQGSNPSIPHCRWILYQLSYKVSQRILEWVAIPSPANLPYPRIKPGSPGFQADSLATELSGKIITENSLCQLQSILSSIFDHWCNFFPNIFKSPK